MKIFSFVCWRRRDGQLLYGRIVGFGPELVSIIACGLGSRHLLRPEKLAKVHVPGCDYPLDFCIEQNLKVTERTAAENARAKGEIKRRRKARKEARKQYNRLDWLDHFAREKKAA